MANVTRNFIKGKMNKMVDERIVPNGEYIDALNARMGSSEGSEIGVIENTKGNIVLTNLQYDGTELSTDARCIGAFDDGANETLYWFVHDSNFTPSSTGKLDLIVSYNTNTSITTYHVISVDDKGGVNTTLNFNNKYLITGVNKIEDLLFFTDNYNAPRRINVNTTYGNPSSGVDGFTDEAILVIKKPPINSPQITPLTTSSEDNFLEDRFISFAYRYRYSDNEYSATSQFSAPTFLPGTFNYDIATALNEGMLNTTNQCEIVFNTGGELVKSIELLFKDMNSSVIKVIEELDKDVLGLSNDADESYVFTNSKIFTILPESEILRLYDNVPRLAQAQTLMGNRLFYGNYLEDYKLIDLNDEALKLEYITTLSSEEVGLETLTHTLGDNQPYYIDNNISTTVTDSIVFVDFAGVNLVAGALINITLRFEHAQWSGDTPYPVETTQEQTITFNYRLQQDFNSPYDLSTDPDFIDKVGTAGDIESVTNSCNGSTFTDIFNCTIPNELAGTPTLYKYKSGVVQVDEPIRLLSSPSITTIGFQIPAMAFVDVASPFTGITQTSYEYYSITNVDAVYQKIGSPSSLHSNRGYEVGIIYMDEYGRSTTALVSPQNNVHVPCSSSEFKNTIDVTIPATQVAPYWAKRYKFCIKPDKKDYDTIYTNFFFRDPTSGADYFLLEGQNSQKIEEGDELIVKRDTSGAKDECTWVTVLEKEAKQKNFLDPKPIDGEGNEIDFVPAGTYMKIRANNFSTAVGDLPFVTYDTRSDEGAGFRQVNYPIDREDPATPGSYIPYTIPAGSRIKIKIKNKRIQPINLWKVNATFTSSQFYPSFQEWFEGDNIDAALSAQAIEECDSFSSCTITGPNYDLSGAHPIQVSFLPPIEVKSVIWNDGTRTYFNVVSTFGISGLKKKKVKLDVLIEVLRTENTIVFESDPQDAEPDLWYESSQSFGITAAGDHLGNTQDQNISTSTPGIVKTAFFNCYAFGNGVESYKINDSLVGKELVLGNRATSTNSEVYDEERRFSDLTYSGVFNPESNINKLNEFNLGLLNFKPLESSFGPVMKLFARETDILTLQEDKISYVQESKNLLSEAAGGGIIASIPEVLGKQIARVEEYGISHNPESFANFGSDKYFTDAKRGAVIQLKGGTTGSDQLNVISMQGMRNWFRDLFNVSFETQKLGGFDPYMNEYVLSSNTIALPSDIDCINCGTTQTISITTTDPYSLCYDVGSLVGDVDIDYEVVSGDGTFNVTANYNGVDYSSGDVSTSGVLTFDKSSVSNQQATVSITSTNFVTLNVTVKCPEENIINIILVTLTSNSDTGDVIHNEYRWVDGTFTSPLHSEQVYFTSGTHPVISSYRTITGAQGGGVIPSNAANVTMISNQRSLDTFRFDILTDNFRYLRSNTLYQNNQTDINALLAASTEATPISGPTFIGTTQYSANFAMPASGSNLYLIWDYTNSTELDLCYGTDEFDACCVCAPPPSGYINRKSLSIDGVNQYVKFSDTTGFPEIAGMTISCWFFNNGDDGTDRYIWGGITSSNRYVYCRQTNTNQILVALRNGDIAGIANYLGTIPVNAWTHLTVTWESDGIGNLFEQKVYLNGVLAGTDSDTSFTPSNANFFPSVFAIGEYENGTTGVPSGTPFDAPIDQVVLWNVVLSESEIKELVQLRDIEDHSQYAEVTNWYEFEDDDIVGTTLTDKAGTEDGTLINGATNTVCIPYPYPYQLGAANDTIIQLSDGGWAWDFDGVNDSIDITSGGGATLTEGSTSIWMKFDFAKTHGGVDGVYTLYIDGSNYIQLFYQVSVDAFDFRYNGGGSIRTARVNYDDMPARGSWFNIILTYSITDDEAKILINGIEKNSISSLTAMTGSISSVNFGSLGAVTGYNGLYKITDVCNFNKALSAAEALEIFNNNQPRNEMNESLSGDIVGYWRGRNSSIGTGSVLDMSTNSNNGTMVNMTETDVVYQYPRTAFDLANGNEGSFKFDGSTQYVNVPNSSDLTFTNGATVDDAFTVAFWINTDDIASNDIIVKSNEFLIGGNSSSRYYLRLYTDATNYLSVRTDTSYTAGKWQFIAITYDANGVVGGVGSIVVYVDGDEGSSTDEGSTGTYTGMTNTGNPIQIGDTSEMNMNGVTFFNRVLTGCEVRELYNTGSPISISNFTASATAISHWRMDATDDPTGTVTDTVGSNNGTAISMTAGSLETDNYPTN